MELKSCIYRGVVRHRRFSPVEHRLRMPLFMLFLDLDELDRVFEKRWLWSASRPAPAWLRRKDHLGDPAIPLDVAVRDLVEQRTGERPTGAIRMLTHLRYFGYFMNPIGLFFCHDAADRIQSIVAEVNNTPWRERHCYVLQPQENAGGKLRFRQPKQFHVSPFMGMDMQYDWTISRPGRRFALHVQNHEQGKRVFDATMTMKREPIRGTTLNRLLLRYPLMTLQVVISIYFHAGMLWLKGTPFHGHPDTLASEVKK